MTCVNDQLIQQLEAEITTFKSTYNPRDRNQRFHLIKLEGRLRTLQLQATVD